MLLLGRGAEQPRDPRRAETAGEKCYVMSGTEAAYQNTEHDIQLPRDVRY